MPLTNKYSMWRGCERVGCG